PYFMLVGQPEELGRSVMMGAGWVINVAIAEWIIRTRVRRPSGVRVPTSLAGNLGGAVSSLTPVARRAPPGDRSGSAGGARSRAPPVGSPSAARGPPSHPDRAP